MDIDILKTVCNLRSHVWRARGFAIGILGEVNYRTVNGRGCPHFRCEEVVAVALSVENIKGESFISIPKPNPLVVRS